MGLCIREQQIVVESFLNLVISGILLQSRAIDLKALV